jgi:hypothetical protein
MNLDDSAKFAVVTVVGQPNTRYDVWPLVATEKLANLPTKAA